MSNAAEDQLFRVVEGKADKHYEKVEIDLPVKLLGKLRTYCLINGIDLSDLIVRSIEEKLNHQ